MPISKSGFCVISETGRKLGCYPSREEAEERLDQVERFAADAVRLSAAAPLALGVDLAQPVVDRPGSRRAWLDLTREGVFAGYPTADGEGIEITRETLGHLLAKPHQEKGSAYQRGHSRHPEEQARITNNARG